MLPIKQILVPVDWEEQSNRAFQLAASLAREHDAQLLVLYAVPLPAVMYGQKRAYQMRHSGPAECLGAKSEASSP